MSTMQESNIIHMINPKIFLRRMTLTASSAIDVANVIIGIQNVFFSNIIKNLKERAKERVNCII